MLGQFFFLIGVVLPVFAVMALGYLMRRIGVLSGEADRSLIQVVVTLLAPCLAFDTIIGNEALAEPANWIVPPILGFASIVLGIGVSRVFARIFHIPPGAPRRTFVFVTSIQNYGYIPLPLCQALFDRATMGVLFAFYLGVELAFWSIALGQMIPRSPGGRLRLQVNPPMVAIPLAILLNALGAKSWLPSSLATTFHLLGACAVPMGLLLSGALIADHLRRKSFAGARRTLLAATAARLAVIPALIILFAKLLPADPALKAVLVVQAAMPAGIFPIVLTKVHHGDVPTALQVVLGTSAIGLATIPLWLGLGMHWVLGLP